jgi:hypothetical protein
MESAYEGLISGINVFLLILALTFFLGMNHGLDTLLFTAKDQICEKNVLYEQEENWDEINGQVIEYKDLISILMKDITTDISIDQMELSKQTYDYMQFDLSSIKKSKYKEKFIRDEKGTVIRIQYQSIS